jgi:circadian clock protein KaiB
MAPHARLDRSCSPVFCETHLADRYEIEVVDLRKNPKLNAGDQILAIPTLVRKLPQPVKKIIGDMSNTERILVGMDLCTAEEKRAAAKTPPK